MVRVPDAPRQRLGQRLHHHPVRPPPPSARTLRPASPPELPRPRYIYIVQTDTGVEGIGEYHALEPQETIDQYVGTNPFDCAPPLPPLASRRRGVVTDAG